MARKKHQIKMFSSPRDILMSSTVSVATFITSREKSVISHCVVVDVEVKVGVTFQQRAGYV